MYSTFADSARSPDTNIFVQSLHMNMHTQGSMLEGFSLVYSTLSLVRIWIAVGEKEHLYPSLANQHTSNVWIGRFPIQLFQALRAEAPTTWNQIGPCNFCPVKSCTLAFLVCQGTNRHENAYVPSRTT